MRSTRPLLSPRRLTSNAFPGLRSGLCASAEGTTRGTGFSLCSAIMRPLVGAHLGHGQMNDADGRFVLECAPDNNCPAFGRIPGGKRLWGTSSFPGVACTGGNKLDHGPSDSLFRPIRTSPVRRRRRALHHGLGWAWNRRHGLVFQKKAEPENARLTSPASLSARCTVTSRTPSCNLKPAT
jgi:hypothetical protein